MYLVTKDKKYLTGHGYSPFGYKFHWSKLKKDARKMKKELAEQLANQSNGKIEKNG